MCALDTQQHDQFLRLLAEHEPALTKQDRVDGAALLAQLDKVLEVERG